MGFADIHERTKAQVEWDAEYAGMLVERFGGNSRRTRRYMERKHGKRPGGGRGLNYEAGRHL